MGWGAGPEVFPSLHPLLRTPGRATQPQPEAGKGRAALTGGVEGRGCAIGPAVLHGKHLHKLLLEDRQKVGDAVIQADIEDELEKWGGNGVKTGLRSGGMWVTPKKLSLRDSGRSRLSQPGQPRLLFPGMPWVPSPQLLPP